MTRGKLALWLVGSLCIVMAFTSAALAASHQAQRSHAPARQTLPIPIVSMIPNSCTPSTTYSLGASGTACIVFVTPAKSISGNGVEFAINLVCDHGIITNGLYGYGGTAAAPTVAPGCYNVSASTTALRAPAGPPFTQFVCGQIPADIQGNCAGWASPICPAGTLPATRQAAGPTTPCTANATGGYVPENEVTAYINPREAYAGGDTFVVTFTGYVPTTASGGCPGGTIVQPNIVSQISTGVPPTTSLLPSGPTGPGGSGGGMCRFYVQGSLQTT